MPWKPPHELPAENPRLERYRHRVGRVRDGQGHEGLVLVVPDVCWTELGGLLWWRRWSGPSYCAYVWMVFPWQEIPFTDSFVEVELLEAELDDWDAGRFMYAGETLAVDWLNREESQNLAANEFGL